MITITKLNESFLKITGDYEDLIVISEYFTRYAPNYIWNPRYKAGVWDGKIRFFNLTTGLIPYGLNHMLEDCINKNNITAIGNLGNGTIKFDENIFNEVIGSFKKYTPHQHQIDGAREAILNGRGLLEHATSSGKTLTLFFILSYYLKVVKDCKIMVVVPNKGLISQFCSNFEDYGMNPKLIGKYFGEEKDLSKPITVGTWQSLKKVKKYLEEVEISLADEVHHAKAIEIKQLFENCTNAFVRIGVTGSLHSNECDLLSIIGGFGPILDSVKTSELIKGGIVSPVDIIQINYHYSKEVAKTCKKDYHLERNIIQNDNRRMLLVQKLLEKQKETDNILLLFDELDFGERYFEFLKSKFPNKHFKYVAGEVSAKEREDIRIFATNNENVVIVASLGTYSTGIDIPRLHVIIFLWMGKSDVRLKQSIGRGLRKHISKEKLIIYDICDQLKYSKGHATERLKIYMKEGYPVKSIEVGKEIK